MILYNNLWNQMSDTERAGAYIDPDDLESLNNTHVEDQGALFSSSNVFLMPGTAVTTVYAIAFINHTHTAGTIQVDFKDGTTTEATETVTPESAPHSRWRRNHIVIPSSPVDIDRIQITPSGAWSCGRVFIAGGSVTPDDEYSIGWNLEVLESGLIRYNTAGEPRPVHGRTYMQRSVNAMDVDGDDMRTLLATGGEMLFVPDNTSAWYKFRRSIYGVIRGSSETQLQIDESTKETDHSFIMEEL